MKSMFMRLMGAVKEDGLGDGGAGTDAAQPVAETSAPVAETPVAVTVTGPTGTWSSGAAALAVRTAPVEKPVLPESADVLTEKVNAFEEKLIDLEAAEPPMPTPEPVHLPEPEVELANGGRIVTALSEEDLAQYVACDAGVIMPEFNELHELVRVSGAALLDQGEIDDELAAKAADTIVVMSDDPMAQAALVRFEGQIKELWPSVIKKHAHELWEETLRANGKDPEQPQPKVGQEIEFSRVDALHDRLHALKDRTAAVSRKYYKALWGYLFAKYLLSDEKGSYSIDADAKMLVQNSVDDNDPRKQLAKLMEKLGQGLQG